MTDKAVRLGNTPIGVLTKREYFTGLAMLGLLANHSHLKNVDAIDFAMTGVRCADALLEELSKPENE